MAQPHPRQGYYDAREVLEAARGGWAGILAGYGVRTEYLDGRHGPCPGCGGRDRFRFDDQNGEGSFLCSQGGGGLLTGNGLTLLQHVTGWSWKECVESLGQRLLQESSRRFFNGGMGPYTGAIADPNRPPPEPMPEEPRAEERPAIPPYDPAMLASFTQSMPSYTRADLKRVSPVRVETATASDFIEVLYGTDERVLVFTEFYSQGNFLHQVGKGSCRLSPTKGIKAVISPLPSTGREGVWFLCNPVNGKWEPTHSRRQLMRLPVGLEGPPEMRDVPGKWGRRSWQSVTSYRYAVLESDVASEDLWLKALVKLPIPIVAIYSSGGKSLHALVRIDADDKLHWDLWVRGRNQGTHGRHACLMDLVCPLGADASALTAVRLTRLPFCMREGTVTKGSGYQRYQKPRLQELIYLNPIPLDRKAPWGQSIELRHRGGSR